MKRFPIVLIISASTLLTACDNRPTLDRAVLEGYNKCVETATENNKGLGRYEKGHTSPTMIEMNCKGKYGIDGFKDITEYRIVN